MNVGTRLCTTKCDHYFHPACLHDWLSSTTSQGKCICRVRLNPDDLEPNIQAEPILHFETAQRAKHLIKYTATVNSYADALIKQGSINHLPIEWAMDKLNPTGDMPKNPILEDRARRILGFSREDKRSFKSGFPTATRSNTIYTAPKTPANQMTEVQIDCEGERYYMWVDLSQSVLVVGQAWHRVEFGMDHSSFIAGCWSMKLFVRFANTMLSRGQRLQEVCKLMLSHL